MKNFNIFFTHNPKWMVGGMVERLWMAMGPWGFREGNYGDKIGQVGLDDKGSAISISC